jgi:hypothetical protein
LRIASRLGQACLYHACQVPACLVLQKGVREMLTKQKIENAFMEAGLVLDKVRKSKLGGFYVYHPFGTEYVYKKYTEVERGEGYVKKLREPKQVRLNFMDNDDMLNMAIAEAKTRKKYQ